MKILSRRLGKFEKEIVMTNKRALSILARVTLAGLLLGAALTTWLANTRVVFSQQPQEKNLNPDRSRTAFVYQGQLKEGNLPANDAYNFQFTLHTAQSGGTELGSIARERIAL